MGVVAAPLVVKVALAVASRPRRIAGTVLRAKAVQAGPRFQQCAVDREVIVRQQPLDFWLRQHGGEKLLRHLAREQPVAVFGERRGIPYRVFDAQPDKPAEQQVIFDPLNQRPLRADRIKSLQQQDPHQPLRRDRTASNRRIQRLERSRQGCQRRIGDLPNRPQRMSRSNPLLQVCIAEKATTNLIVAAHRSPRPPLQRTTMRKINKPFSAAC